MEQKMAAVSIFSVEKIMKLWWICLVCIFYSGTIKAAGTNEVKDFEKALIAKNETAQKMIDAYRSLQTYEAVWNTDIPREGNTEQKFETKILFDGKTNNAVYLMNSKTRHEDGKSEEKLSILVIKNKNTLSVYSDFGLSQEPVIKELTKTDPNEITYRDIRKAIFLFYPTDLAMIMSNTPLHEALQGSPEYKLITKKTVIDQNRRMLFMCTSLISDYISTIKIS